MAVLQLLSTKRLRHQGVEAQQESHSEDRERHEEDTADTDRADGLRAQPADHADVDDAHGDPAQLRDDHWHREGDHRLDFTPHRSECRRHLGSRTNRAVTDKGGRAGRT